MLGPSNEMYQDPNEGLADSTESSLYTESTGSRIPCNAQPRQTARILLEKRRQELPKMSPIEQAYMRNSRKQVPYHPLKQPAPNGIIQTIKAAHTNRIKQLENQVAEDQIKLNEYVTELRTMKTQQKRLETELKKYQGMAGNIPIFMRGQEEELRAVQHELKKAKLQNMRLGQSLASREDELKRVKQENQRWRRLEDLTQLEDREKLFDQNEELKHQITRQNDKIMMLTRKGMLEVKNLKCELSNERRKHRATQQALADMADSSEKLRSDLELKQKYITYNSLRFAAGREKKAVPNGLESISLITLTGNNRYLGAQAPMRLDPELVRHYPKTPATAPTAPKRPELSTVDNTHRNTPAATERSPIERTAEKSPPVPLPRIRTNLEGVGGEEEEDATLSEGSDLLEEEMNVYSSGSGSQGKGGGDSSKSSPGLVSPDASETTPKKNGVGLPNLAGLSRYEKKSPGVSPPATREQRLAREYAEMEQRVMCEKTRGEAIRSELEGYLKVDAEGGPQTEMDPATKGKLLAALRAIEKGGEPAGAAPRRGSVFTPPPVGRPARRERLDPVTRSELIRELFGGVDYPPLELAPPIHHDDNNNEESSLAEGDGLYAAAAPRVVRLTNWKH